MKKGDLKLSRNLADNWRLRIREIEKAMKSFSYRYPTLAGISHRLRDVQENSGRGEVSEGREALVTAGREAGATILGGATIFGGL